MSNTTITEPITPVESPPTVNGEVSKLVTNAREIIAGRVVPTVEPDAAIDAWIADSLKHADPPPLAGPLQRIRTRMYLDKRYPGKMVMWFELPDQSLFPLAIGWDEIQALTDGLTPSENSKIVVACIEFPGI